MRRFTKLGIAALTALSFGTALSTTAHADPYWGRRGGYYHGGGYYRGHDRGIGAGGALALGLGVGVLGALALNQAAPPPPVYYAPPPPVVYAPPPPVVYQPPPVVYQPPPVVYRAAPVYPETRAAYW
ncbi:hypothetical protein [Roseomonas elaeocarpi]|uniref:Uncharacterized protein n=1 Tax=Roseomonas elaeocarpi TaxID=907779 RepID=A0ABV6JX04_9PROT